MSATEPLRESAPAGPVQPGAVAFGPTPVPPLELKRTRTGSVYVASIVGIVLLALVIAFIVQNLHEASVTFLAWTFRLPVGIVVLVSALAGAVVVVLISLARILQLRLAARRHRRAHAHA